MQALTLRQIKTPLELVERPDLGAAPGEVVVQVKAAALNRRDYWITQGLYPGVAPPVVPGSDAAGIVTQCGDGVDRSWQGKEVIINPGIDWGSDPTSQGSEFTILGVPRDGTLATEVSVPASQLHPKPSHMNWPQAAGLPLAGVTAYRALFTQGGLRSGQTVLITGIGGGVATFALQFAKAVGATAWVTSSSADKIEKAKQLGAAGGFNYKEENWSKVFSGEAGSPHLIIDSAGGSGYRDLVNVVAPGGRIVNYGATAGPPEKLDLFKIFWKQVRIQGSTMGSPADFEAMLRFVDEHQLTPVIDSVRPFAEGDAAIQSMGSSPQFGKLVLEI